MHLQIVTVGGILGLTSLGQICCGNEAERIVPLVIFVSELGKEGLVSGATPKLGAEARWLEFADGKFARYHVRIKNGPVIIYSESSHPKDPSTNHPKLINYCVRESDLDEAMRFLWRVPEVVKVVVDSVVELQRGSGDGSSWPRLVVVSGPGKARTPLVQLTKRIDNLKGAKKLGWDEGYTRCFFSCDSVNTFAKIESEVESMENLSVSVVRKKELEEDGLMDKSLSKYFKYENEESYEFRTQRRIKASEGASIDQLLKKVPDDILVVELSTKELVLLATNAEISHVSRLLK